MDSLFAFGFPFDKWQLCRSIYGKRLKGWILTLNKKIFADVQMLIFVRLMQMEITIHPHSEIHKVEDRLALARLLKEIAWTIHR